MEEVPLLKALAREVLGPDDPARRQRRHQPRPRQSDDQVEGDDLAASRRCRRSGRSSAGSPTTSRAGSASRPTSSRSRLPSSYGRERSPRPAPGPRRTAARRQGRGRVRYVPALLRDHRPDVRAARRARSRFRRPARARRGLGHQRGSTTRKARTCPHSRAIVGLGADGRAAARARRRPTIGSGEPRGDRHRRPRRRLLLGLHADARHRGDFDGEMREAYDTVLAAQQAGLDAIRAGESGVDVDAAARDVIEDSDFAGHVRPRSRPRPRPRRPRGAAALDRERRHARGRQRRHRRAGRLPRGPLRDPDRGRRDRDRGRTREPGPVPRRSSSPFPSL